MGILLGGRGLFRPNHQGVAAGEEKQRIELRREPEQGIDELVNPEGLRLSGEFPRRRRPDMPVAELGLRLGREEIHVEGVEDELHEFREKPGIEGLPGDPEAGPAETLKRETGRRQPAFKMAPGM